MGQSTQMPSSSLDQRGIKVIPDILANAGGVTCSYFEQVQSNMNYYWKRDEVLGKLDVHLTSIYIDISNIALSRKLSLRDAVYLVAVDKVARACRSAVGRRRSIVLMANTNSKSTFRSQLIDFDRNFLDPDTPLTCIGEGEIGGKAEGLALISNILHQQLQP